MILFFDDQSLVVILLYRILEMCVSVFWKFQKSTCRSDSY